MAPLNPLPCSAKGCDCRTPSETNEDLKDQLEHLNSHSQAAHPENHAPALEEPESSGRPEAWEDMWSWQWESFQMEWEKYKREKNLLDEKKLLDELWECMSKRLSRRVIEEL